jgi:NADPH-dependent curcumin reductase CurA
MTDPTPRVPATRQRVLLRRRPEGLLDHHDVELVTEEMPELAEGEALLANEVLGIDASVRSWLGAGSGYLPAVELGEAVRCSTIGRVVATRCDRYGIGDIITTLGGWEDYSVRWPGWPRGRPPWSPRRRGRRGRPRARSPSCRGPG